MNDKQLYPKLPELHPAYARIVTRIMPDDPDREYDELERKLKIREISPHRAESSIIVDRLDEAQDCAWRAHKLHLGGRVAFEAFEVDAKIKLAPIRDGATVALQDEKAKGIRSKQITDADVESKMAEMYPDEWSAISIERVRVRKALEKLEDLAKLWQSRASTLEAELRTSRSRGSSLID